MTTPTIPELSSSTLAEIHRVAAVHLYSPEVQGFIAANPDASVKGIVGGDWHWMNGLSDATIAELKSVEDLDLAEGDTEWSASDLFFHLVRAEIRRLIAK